MVCFSRYCIRASRWGTSAAAACQADAQDVCAECEVGGDGLGAIHRDLARAGARTALAAPAAKGRAER